ncbi:MAG TPA: hypothetical protein VK306_05920 [Acidimicrobiales bacterium]|nr:hypothetical protein [Acidimicrobiales bacterium]
MVNVTKVRIGLAIIGVVIAAALVTMFAVDAPAGKAVMFAIALTALVRAFMLYRSLKAERAEQADGTGQAPA